MIKLNLGGKIIVALKIDLTRGMGKIITDLILNLIINQIVPQSCSVSDASIINFLKPRKERRLESI